MPTHLYTPVSIETVVITGGRGYLASVPSTALSTRGRVVRTIDNGPKSSIFPSNPNVSHIEADMRNIADWAETLSGVDAVVHLAVVVGDPACQVDHDLAWETNYFASVHLAEACRRRGVGVIVASTCKNYGSSDRASAGIVSPLYPQSVYAKAKIHAEHHLRPAWNGHDAPAIMRSATLYGVSPRMRFDLAVRAVLEGRVRVHGRAQWRPFLRVQDAAHAVPLALAGGPGTSRLER